MTPEETKQFAKEEANKHLSKCKEKVVVLMPVQQAWIDPTEEDMESIRDYAMDRSYSVIEFPKPEERQKPGPKPKTDA